MVDFQESKTKENLARSFVAECLEGARYQFMAKMAWDQDFQYLSYLLRTLAKNEMSHAQQFFCKINELGNGEVNNIDIHAGYPFKGGEIVDTLLLESQNEKNSGENVYPAFARIACDEGFKEVAELFDMIAKVELSHQKILEQLHSEFEAKRLYKAKSPKVFKCDMCGYTTKAKQAPKTCPLCKLKQGCFRIDVTIDDDSQINCNCKDETKNNNDCICPPKKCKC